MRLSFSEVFISNFHIIKVLSQLSLKITMHTGKHCSYVFQNTFKFKIQVFKKEAKTKVYALEVSLGVVCIFVEVKQLLLLYQYTFNFGVINMCDIDRSIDRPIPYFEHPFVAIVTRYLFKHTVVVLRLPVTLLSK